MMSDDPTPAQMAYDTFSTIYPEAFKCTLSTFTKGQRKGEACVDKIFKSGSVFEATFFATSISADTPPSDVDNPILLEAGGITLTVTPEHIVPVIAAT